METKLAIALALSSFGADPATVKADDFCRCGITCACADQHVAASKPAVVAKKATTQVLEHAYIGTHAHICPNKDCPFRKTWGEPYVWGGQNHGHVCPYCQTTQTVQSVRPITIVREVAVASAPAKTAAPAMSLTTLQTYAASSSACANGQCSTPAARGFFRRW